MSSKGIGQQQQGRRTPLSLTGGKHNQHHQNQSNASKANHSANNNAAKYQESKDSTSNNKNNNQVAKNQQETRDLPSTQKDTKKAQQNGGNKRSTADNGNDDVIIVEQNGTANGTSNNSSDGASSNKSNGSTTKISNQAGNKDTKEKEKDKDKETESVREKREEKPKKGAAPKPNEKKQNDSNENEAAAAVTPTNSSKSNDGNTTPTSSSPATVEKKQNTQTAVTPIRANALRKSSTPSKIEKTERSATTTPTKSPLAAAATKPTTTSKSPKAASAASSPATEISPEVIDMTENDIEPLIVESSPAKKSMTKHAIAPAATSTPGKAIATKRLNKDKSEIQLTMETRSSVERKSVPRSFSDISGRRSIRSSGDFTSSMYSYNSQFRESYRRINTELDVTGNTNTSMNVTVGSEIPNNSSFLSFSLFGRGRKRERTPPPTTGPGKSQSAVELTTETTPPKRARLDVHGIFSAMSSPLTMLRSRFSKATLETPNKVEQPTIEDDVHNVSGVSIEEVASSAEVTATAEDITVGKEVVPETTPTKKAEELQNNDDATNAASMDVDGDDIIITETPIIPAVGEPKTKQKGGCLIM